MAFQYKRNLLCEKSPCSYDCFNVFWLFDFNCPPALIAVTVERCAAVRDIMNHRATQHLLLIAPFSSFDWKKPFAF
ncbi:hypothetical protein F2P81_011412 [Scophthalmus maximus]|uniref:Uncharacterized protein n=1 Tax=Scophthalmus maximus TaxID=52904 RepID=A0A6A4SW54_SCOMX|nr:hypothetical protein F2P81_011412 [Scophthalmus maximus]